MRQEVKKAKLYTINKLTRESRRLKSRNGPEEIKKKYNRKAERLMEEVLTVKVGTSVHYSC
jgi:phage host-nuclease inhibitor protein Gam